MGFFKSWFGIDEQRVSALIISLLSTMVVALYSYMTKGDISRNLVTVLEALVTAVAGVNMTNTVVNWLSNRGTPSVPSDTTRSEEGPPPAVNNAGKL